MVSALFSKYINIYVLHKCINLYKDCTEQPGYILGDVLLDIDNGRGGDLHAPPTQHFTMIFNVFVMMTLFNEINARKIHGQRNVFIGLFTNPIYYVIWIATFISQVLNKVINRH